MNPSRNRKDRSGKSQDRSPIAKNAIDKIIHAKAIKGDVGSETTYFMGRP